MNPQPHIPQVARLRELFWYDIDGNLSRRVAAGRGGRESEGAIVGSLNGSGYLVVTVDGMRLLAHRIAFAMSHGEWPHGQIDHIDGNRTNNRLSNLRDVTPGENNQNQRRARGNSTSGFLGVSRQRQRWKAEIKLDGRRYCLGTYDTPEEAHEAYLTAKRDLHPGAAIAQHVVAVANQRRAA
jgi:hypothetical protein